MISIDIDERGLGTIGIIGADGSVNDYRIRLMPRGLSLWSAELARTDTGDVYAVRLFLPNRWECSCPAEKYRKRGKPHCKHIEAMSSFRAWLEDFLSGALGIHPSLPGPMSGRAIGGER